MKHNMIKTGKELLVTQMNHWVLVAIAVTIMGLFGYENPQVWLWAVWGVIPVWLYMVRTKVQNFFLFFFLHVVLPAAVIFLPMTLWVKLLILGITLFYVIWSVKIRLSEQTDESGVFAPAFSVVAIGAMSLIQGAFGQSGWDRYYMLAIFIYLISYFIYYFVSQYIRFLIVHESTTANIPEKAIFFSGMKQTLAYTAGGMLLLILTANIEWLSYVVSLIGNGLLAMIRFIVSFINFKAPETEQGTPAEQAPLGDMEGLMEAGEAHIFWIILEKILMAAVGIGFILLIVFAIVKGYQYLWTAFHKAGNQKEAEVQDGQDIRERCTIEKSKNASLQFFSFLNNRDKIRRVYRKRVLKSKDSIIGDLHSGELEYLTAKECCEKISADGLRAIYEKARYSEEQITAEDVRMVKAAGKERGL